jgi:hypothetical protein
LGELHLPQARFRNLKFPFLTPDNMHAKLFLNHQSCKIRLCIFT